MAIRKETVDGAGAAVTPCPDCHDTGWMTLGGRVIVCTCPAGNVIYWEQKRRAAEAEKERYADQGPVRDEDE